MKTLTKMDIAKIVHEIKMFLEDHDLAEDVCIYYNNKRESSSIKLKKNYDYDVEWDIEYNIDPHDYFEWAAYEHIISMSFEGELYDLINYRGGKALDEFDKLLEKHGLYYELGNAWNLTVYVIDPDEMNVEYTVYDCPEPPIELHLTYDENPICFGGDDKLRDIMIAWRKGIEKVGDQGSCVFGAGFEFEYEGKKYRMAPPTHYQGSISWETDRADIERQLENIGATEIIYNWGSLD